MKHFIKHYAEFKKSEEGRPAFEAFPLWVQFTRETPFYLTESKANVVIQVIGVWDTVGSLGVPELGHFWTFKPADTKYYEFHDTNLNPCT